MSAHKIWADFEYDPQADPRMLGITIEDFHAAGAAAKEACNGKYEMFGYQLWFELVVRRNAFVAEVERVVGRLPPNAFGSVGPLPFTIAILDWSRYRAESEYEAIHAFKNHAIGSGWTPAQANSYMLALRTQEQAVMGPWKPGTEDPMPRTAEPPGLNARQKAIFDHMRSNFAFPQAQ